MPIYPTLKQVPAGLSVQRQAPSRVPRNPKHTHHLRHKPHVLQPFCIAPVLAGETLDRLFLQDRVVTDLVKGRLVGWWLEHWYFFVPLRSIRQSPFDVDGAGVTNDRTPTETMLLNQAAPLAAATYATASTDLTSFYEYDAGTDTAPMAQWLRSITAQVAQEFFADEGVTVPTIDGLPLLKMNSGGWTDSVFKASELPSVIGSFPVDAVPTPDEADIDLGDLDGYYQTYLALKQQTMSDLTFEDYLMTFGIKPKAQKSSFEIELLEYKRDWSYPTNTIGTSGEDLGVPSAAVSWSTTIASKKRRLFKEPGFVVGFTCARPKLYLGRQRAYAAMHMADAFSWMPASLKQNVETSLKEITAAQGVLGGTGARDTDNYVFDMRDLFIHGDQFIAGVALDGTAPSLHVALDPHEDDTHDQAKYIDATDQMACFLDTTLGRIEHDGMTTLSVLGTQVDHT